MSESHFDGRSLKARPVVRVIFATVLPGPRTGSSWVSVSSALLLSCGCAIFRIFFLAPKVTFVSENSYAAYLKAAFGRGREGHLARGELQKTCFLVYINANEECPDSGSMASIHRPRGSGEQRPAEARSARDACYPQNTSPTGSGWGYRRALISSAARRHAATPRLAPRHTPRCRDSRRGVSAGPGGPRRAYPGAALYHV